MKTMKNTFWCLAPLTSVSSVGENIQGSRFKIPRFQDSKIKDLLRVRFGVHKRNYSIASDPTLLQSAKHSISKVAQRLLA